jgi:hypothetical protein
MGWGIDQLEASTQADEKASVSVAQAIASHITQVQVRPMYYTSGSSRDLRVGDAVVHLRHVSADKLQCAGSQAGLALCALFYIGRRELTGAMVQTILSRLDTDEVERLMRCRMPRWMRKMVDGAYGQVTPASARGKG